MMLQRNIRVLCVDDHFAFRRLLELLIDLQPGLEAVGALEHADDLEERLEALHPDVVVLDMSMPGRAPLEALRSARASHPDVRFLVSSAYDDPSIVEEALLAGANGFLVKDGSLDELVTAIQTVARNEIVLPRRGLGSWSS